MTTPQPLPDPLPEVHFRPVEADDVERLRRLFYRLSPETVYLRFFQPVHEPSNRMLRHLAGVDHNLRDAIAAVVDDEIVGVARYDRLKDDPDKADVAIVVEDAWQGHGLARALLAQLRESAREHGVKSLGATVLGENRRMLAVARHLDPSTRVHLDHGEWELEIPLVSS